MKIAQPPRTTNTEENLVKQGMVFDLCYDKELDVMLTSTLDCPLLERTHSEEMLQRARRSGINGFSVMDYRKVAHAEASCSAFHTATMAAIGGLHDGVPAAFAPVSGFHHATWDSPNGFCTFNGLIAVAKEVLDRKLADRILIVDGDGHWGDGTNELIDHHHLKGKVVDWWVGGDRSKDWQDLLWKRAKSFDLIMYQAGADAHRDDPYCVGKLDSSDWMLRDEAVFGAAKAMGVPLVWNLAGGYNGARTLDLHVSTFKTACKVYYPGIRRKAIARGDTLIMDQPAAASDLG